MPFLARCSCGFEIEGDCSQNGHLLAASDARHLHIEDGRVVCNSPLEILTIEMQARNRHLPAVHPKERSIVWHDPKTGEIAYPGRNDRPMPERYRKAGYERREFTSLRQLDQFCKERGLVNEKSHYDSNGKGAEYAR